MEKEKTRSGEHRTASLHVHLLRPHPVGNPSLLLIVLMNLFVVHHPRLSAFALWAGYDSNLLVVPLAGVLVWDSVLG